MPGQNRASIVCVQSVLSGRSVVVAGTTNVPVGSFNLIASGLRVYTCTCMYMYIHCFMYNL